MNKIYKVVWSKAKHCYVVTSELAKRNTKGCGARSLRMAAVSLGVAAALMGGFSTTAEAKSVSKVIIDYSGYYVFQHSPKSLTVNQEAIDNVDSWTGNTYAYGNVRRGDSRAVTDVYYTIEDGESVRHSDINIYYGNPADPQSYFPVLTQNPFNDTTVIENNAIQYGTYSTIGEFAKADPDAKKEVTGYSLTLTGTGLNEAAGALSYGGNVNNNAITVDGGSANTVYGGVTTKGEATNNAVTVNSGTVDRLYGGKSSGIYESVDGKANDNTVIINNGTVKEVNGGAVTYGSANTNHVYMNNGAVNYLIGGDGGKSANYNEVIISGGAVNKSTGKDEAIIGGRVASTEAKGNTVTIKGDAKVTGDVLGASSWYGDAVITDNTVTIKGNAVVTGNVTGALGLDNYDKKKNTVNIEENAQVTGNVYGGRISKQGYWEPYDGNADTNAVNIKGGTVTGNVYGGSVEESSTRGAINNTVTIDGGTVSSTVYGGYSYNGEATGNMVTMTAGQVNSSVYGGVSETKAASSNNVKVSGGKVSGGVIGGRSGKDYGDGHPAVEDVKNNTVEISGDAEVTSAVYGGRITNATANVEDNTVTIKDSSKVNRGIHGGQTNYGNAIHNKVTIEGGTITGQSYGDYVTGGRVSSDSNGKAQNNEVEISGGTVRITVQGGFAQGGETTGNKVTISGGTVTATVEGAYNTGDVANNSVTITGGKLSNLVSGGRGSGSATGNTVTISGGTDSWIIIGGNGMRGATGNTVTISGGDLTVTQDRARPIYGGYTDFYDDSPRDATGNTVNLTGNTTGLETRNIVGGYIHNEGSGDVVSGNELHVGGTKDGSITGTWTGSSNNKVNKVANFETIAYHSVKWDTSVAALEATTVENVGAIDINNLAFTGAASSGTMALLKSGSDLSAIKLKYSGSATGVAITTDGVVIRSGGGTPTTETDGVNGVKLTATSSEKVLLASDGKAINYRKGADAVSGISFGEFDTAEAARDLTGAYFTSTNTVDAIGLAFKNTTEALEANDDIALVQNATGVTTTVDNNTGKTIGINYTDDQNIKFVATATGDVTSADGTVKYTVSSVAVRKIDVSQWNGTSATVTASWDTKDAAVKTEGISVSGLNPGDSKPILSAASGFDFSNVIMDPNAWSASGTITDTAENGVTIAGETSGGGVKVSDDKSLLIYQQDKKNVTDIILGDVAFTKDGTARAFNNSYDLTAAAIGVTAFTLSNKDAVKASMKTGDTMVIVDATGTIAGAGGTQTLKDFDPMNAGAAIDFEDSITGKSLSLSGTHQDTLELNEAKTQILYKVGEKNVSNVKFDGAIDFVNGATHYEADASQYIFTGTTNVDAEKLTFNETTEAVAVGQAMTLLSATEMNANVTVQPTDATVTSNYKDAQDIAFNAVATGEVKAATNAVQYEVTGVTLNEIDLTNWKGATSDATGVTAGWTLGTGVTIKTGDLEQADLSSLDPGDTKKIVTVSDGISFTDNMIEGSKKWQAGGVIDDSADNSGVSVTGTTTGGGVKVDATNANTIIYQKDKKTVTDITIGAVDYDTTKAVRTFDSTYDLTGATINADGFSFSNATTATMNAGDTMVVVDATNAIKADGEATKTLKDFETKTMTPIDFSDDISGTVLTFAGKHTDTLEQNEAKTQIVYKVGDKNVEAVTLDGSVTWDDSKAYYENKADANGKFAYTFNGATNVDAENLKVAGTSNTLLKADGSSSMTLLSATGMTAGTFTDQSEANKAASKVSVNYKDDKGVVFKAEAKGEVKAEDAAVKYSINEVKLTEVDLSAWTGSESSVPDTWTAEDGSVKVATGSFAEPDVAIGSARTILTAGSAFFADANISGANKYDEANGKAFSETQNNVTVSGTQAKGVAASEDSKSLVYKVDIKKADTVSFGATNWQKDAVLLDGSSATEYDYAAITTIGTDAFDVTYAAPETVAAGESMTLLKANETLTAIINEEKAKAYSFSPVSGVTVDAAITGKLTNSNNNVVFTAAANQASKLTFGDVEWKDSGALMARPSNITFASADVDTSKINFTNMIYLDADRQMTLVSDFGDKVGTITGSKYLVGTAFEGEGAASLSGSDLVFRTKTGAGVSEQTHKTVMATEVGVTMLTVGNDYIGKAMEGMGDVANVAPDGSTVGAAVGGGRNRYETGSHVNVNSWNAAVAVGAKRELKNGSLEYGVFGEYGKANFTLHSDAGKGDGDSHYAGGGLLAKWTNKHDVYTEASFRLGRLNESSSDIMRDGLGNKYGYDVHANYFGAHVGVGKIFRYKGGKSLDVYGKFFYTKRDGVEFDAVQHYKLDSVKSSVLRIGARYGTTDKKWNWYGGLAYEYEFDGEAKGSVNGTAIRAASIKGSSVRGEIGLRMNATKTNPWQMDISLYGYGVKHRGIGGNVNVAYMF